VRLIGTVRGDIRPDELGHIYGHEHLLMRPGEPVLRECDDLFLPGLRAARFEASAVRALVVENPARLLAWTAVA
jgi:predicted metal-dependent phosphotriesterase family hydrolase